MTQTLNAPGKSAPDAEDVAARRKSGLQAHAFYFTICSAFITELWLITGADFRWLVAPLIVWSIGLVMHAIRVYRRPLHGPGPLSDSGDGADGAGPLAERIIDTSAAANSRSNSTERTSRAGHR